MPSYLFSILFFENVSLFIKIKRILLIYREMVQSWTLSLLFYRELTKMSLFSEIILSFYRIFREIFSLFRQFLTIFFENVTKFTYFREIFTKMSLFSEKCHYFSRKCLNFDNFGTKWSLFYQFWPKFSQNGLLLWALTAPIEPKEPAHGSHRACSRLP